MMENKENNMTNETNGTVQTNATTGENPAQISPQAMANNMYNQQLEEKKKKIKYRYYGWQWMFFVDILIPLVIFVIAFATKAEGLGTTMTGVFRSYMGYVVSPIPNLTHYTGIFGIVFPTLLAIRAVYWKNFGELIAIMVLGVGAFAFFYFGAYEAAILQLLNV